MNDITEMEDQNRQYRKSVRLQAWPFEKHSIAKLLWIDHPVRDVLGNWRMDIYLRDVKNGEIRMCSVLWGTLPLLKLGQLYQDGYLTNELLVKADAYNISNIYFSDEIFELRRGKYSIQTSDNIIHRINKDVFEATKDGLTYRIPVLEVVRSILAPNKRLLYSLLQPNSLDYYLTTLRDNGCLTMNFSKDYPSRLLTQQNILHLAWLATNSHAQRAWGEVYRSLLYDGRIRFKFPLRSKFAFRIRERREKNIIRVMEIIQTKGLVLDIEHIEVISPNLHSNKSLLRGKKNPSGNCSDPNSLVITIEDNGVGQSEKIIDAYIATYQFNAIPTIKKNFNKEFETEKITSAKTTDQPHFANDTVVSTGDTGGLTPKVKGLEYTDLGELAQQYNGEIASFIAALNNIKEAHSDCLISANVNNLTNFYPVKQFSFIDKEKHPRKYAVAKIETDNMTSYVIEVERCGKALSTLLIRAIYVVNELIIEEIILKLLNGLIVKDGSWNTDYLNRLKQKGVQNKRIRHWLQKCNYENWSDKLYQDISGITSL